MLGPDLNLQRISQGSRIQVGVTIQRWKQLASAVGGIAVVARYAPEGDKAYLHRSDSPTMVQ